MMADRTPGWMVHADREILEFLETTDIPVLPGTIAVNLDRRRTTVTSRCHMLADHGLVRRHPRHRRAVVISPRGEDFLAGNVLGGCYDG
jgi:predicted transcriptional regulator